MIYRGTNFTERIQMSPMDRMKTTQWIEMRRFAKSNELEVFLCDDYGNKRNVWSWWFELDEPMTYEQIKFNILEHMFECDTMDELAEVLSEVFEDGFAGVLMDDEECGKCAEKAFEHHNPEYITTLKLGKQNDVWVDILDSGDMFESWLYRKNIGVKSYMFGWPKIQHRNSGKEEYYDLDAYIDIVCENVEEYLEFYDEEYNY